MLLLNSHFPLLFAVSFLFFHFFANRFGDQPITLLYGANVSVAGLEPTPNVKRNADFETSHEATDQSGDKIAGVLLVLHDAFAGSQRALDVFF